MASRRQLRIETGLVIPLFLSVLFFLGNLPPAHGSADPGQPVLNEGPVNCLDCHDHFLYRTAFPKSVHGPLGCLSCHGAIEDREKHMTGLKKPELLSCARCHEEIAASYVKNYHYLYQDFRCTDCHRDIHAVKPPEGSQKQAVLKQCTECHGNDEYAVSGHGLAVLEGNEDAATCSDCHGLHNTRVYHTAQDLYPAEAREFYSRTCIHCHGDRDMMKRNNLSPDVVRFYELTYHGKVQGVGDPSRVAGCADCHTSHNILPKDNPASTIHPDNLAANCGKCHTGFHPRFVEYKAHPDFTNRREYPSLFWTNVFMEALLVMTFLFFWIHTALWWRKTYWDKHDLERRGIIPGPPVAGSEGIQSIRRFSRLEVSLHVILVISFFTLVLTGFPLKYYDAGWAKPIVHFWGGAHKAGLWHRAAAIVLIVLFLYVLVRSLRYLFPKGGGTRGWKDRLFGPDSLFPNWKDWEDLKAMLRWFFNRGDRPRFDRWSYWEKFDFLAVFWGMTIIGGSGIFLMVPEWTSYLFPGWVLNIAALLHSEEALLAALFIFTVHFFNTHLIPTKFPMDRTIFTGRYYLKEMAEERPLEYERMKKEDRIESLKQRHPSIWAKLLAASFGYTGLLLGLFLAAMILWTIVRT